MSVQDETARYAVNAMLQAGADKASCSVSASTKHELNVERAELGLLRTTMNVGINLLAIKDQKKGSISTRRADPRLGWRARTFRGEHRHWCGTLSASFGLLLSLTVQ